MGIQPALHPLAPGHSGAQGKSHLCLELQAELGAAMTPGHHHREFSLLACWARVTPSLQSSPQQRLSPPQAASVRAWGG